MKKVASKVIYQLFIFSVFRCSLFAQSVPDTASPGVGTQQVKILRTWEMPRILKEISGMAYIDPERIACVQDEVGTIFIYNLSAHSIESEIPFGPPGDYEAITVVNDDAYVAAADGRIIEVAGYRTPKPTVRECGTHLTVRQNVEGLCYDKKNNRLLVAIKGQEEGNPLFKGIYVFDLATKTMPVKPVLKIDLQDPVFGSMLPRKPQNVFRPSEIDVHPSTGDIYITDGPRSQVLVMSSTGKIKALYALDREKMIRPEGLIFTPSGELFIASEGNKQVPGKLMQVQLK